MFSNRMGTSLCKARVYGDMRTGPHQVFVKNVNPIPLRRGDRLRPPHKLVPTWFEKVSPVLCGGVIWLPNLDWKRVKALLRHLLKIMRRGKIPTVPICPVGHGLSWVAFTLPSLLLGLVCSFFGFLPSFSNSRTICHCLEVDAMVTSFPKPRTSPFFLL